MGLFYKKDVTLFSLNEHKQSEENSNQKYKKGNLRPRINQGSANNHLHFVDNFFKFSCWHLNLGLKFTSLVYSTDWCTISHRTSFICDIKHRVWVWYSLFHYHLEAFWTETLRQKKMLNFLKLFLVQIILASSSSANGSSECLVREVSTGQLKPCAFPFTFNNRVYSECTKFLDPQNKHW